MKKVIIAVIVLVLVGLGVYFFTTNSDKPNVSENPTPNNVTPEQPVTPVVDKTQTVLGKSVEGRDITAYHFGEGEEELLFIGGIHGGYEWNTSLVAFELMDYLKANPDKVPQNVKVTVLPVMNPDGLNKVVGTPGRFSASSVPTNQETVISGRFNANTVDLNRNFDCDWQSVGKWQSRNVSGGTAAFSEPESQAVRAYVEANDPAGVVVWYSAAGGVFASNCHNGVLAETKTLTNTFAKASGYKAYETFGFYEITGDMVNWLAKMQIPAISVLLTNHSDTEWTKNKAGVDALLNYFGSKAPNTPATTPGAATTPAN